MIGSCRLCFLLLLFGIANTPKAAACKCANSVPLCSLNSTELEKSANRFFVGRVKSASPKGWQEFGEMIMRRIPPDLLANFVSLPPAEREKRMDAASVKAEKEIFLELWGSAMTPEQREKVEKATTYDELEPLTRRDMQRIELEVLESFSDEFRGTVVVRSGLGGGDCGLLPREGETYLVEAGRTSDGYWKSSGCSRTAPISRATAELDVLRAWKANKEMLSRRIQGHLADWTERPEEEAEQDMGSVAVRLLGGDEPRETRTDEYGYFLFEDLDPGVYKVEPKLPGWSLRFNESLTADLTEQSCAVMLLGFSQQRATIRGRILAQPGESIAHYLRVFAIRVNAEGAPLNSTTVENDGTFSFGSLEPGGYAVTMAVGEIPAATNSQPRHERDWPHPPLYYPGDADRARAAVFHLERGQVIELGDWMLSSQLREQRVTVHVVWPAGISGEEVAVAVARPGSNDWMTMLDGDKDENSDLYLLEGVQYELRALGFYGGEFFEGRLVVASGDSSPVSLRLVSVGPEASDNDLLNLIMSER
jgi:hypothetical protein